MGFKIHDASLADFGMDAMTDDGVKQLTPAKKVFTADNYNANSLQCESCYFGYENCRFGERKNSRWGERLER